MLGMRTNKPLKHPHKLAANGPVKTPLEALFRGAETSAPPKPSSKCDLEAKNVGHEHKQTA
eukprot:5751641-Pyramimonas_sp.AAC.1